MSDPGSREARRLALRRERELRRRAALRDSRRAHFVRAAIIGIVSGVVALAFQWALFQVEEGRTLALERLHQHPTWGWMVLPGIGALLGAVAGWLTTRYAPEAAGSGIPHVKAVLHHLRPMRWGRVLTVKFGAGLASLGAGLSLGREGPTVQMGAAVADAVNKLLKVPRRSRSQLIACGAGAGLASAFNAPLAGFIFVIEELQRELSPWTYGAALVATVCADIVTRSFTGQMPSFHFTGYETPPLTALPLFVVLGVAAGGAGVLFNRGLLGTLKWFQAPRKFPMWAWPAVVGLIAGLVAWWMPEAVGGGHYTAERILRGFHAAPELLGFVALLFAVKFAMTMISYGSGAPGGIFAPLLVLGALLGLFTGMIGGSFFPDLARTPAAFAVVGMAAMFAAVVRAPLTGIVLILEMTGNYEQLFALAVACLMAYITAEHFRDKPIYEALLDQDLRRKGIHPVEESEPVLVDLVVEPESPMAHKKVRDLRLPPGCLLVTVRRAGREMVPGGETRLSIGDQLTVIVSGDVAHIVAEITGAAASSH